MQAGSDVVTKTATKRINWTTYKMNKSSDKIGVFVSIVSTKIPYKGAGKEYICELLAMRAFLFTSTLAALDGVSGQEGCSLASEARVAFDSSHRQRL